MVSKTSIKTIQKFYFIGHSIFHVFQFQRKFETGKILFWNPNSINYKLSTFIIIINMVFNFWLSAYILLFLLLCRLSYFELVFCTPLMIMALGFGLWYWIMTEDLKFGAECLICLNHETGWWSIIKFISFSEVVVYMS